MWICLAILVDVGYFWRLFQKTECLELNKYPTSLFTPLRVCNIRTLVGLFMACAEDGRDHWGWWEG